MTLTLSTAVEVWEHLLIWLDDLLSDLKSLFNHFTPDGEFLGCCQDSLFHWCFSEPLLLPLAAGLLKIILPALLAMNMLDSETRIHEYSGRRRRSKSKSLLYYSSCLGMSEGMWTSEEELGRDHQHQIDYCLWGVKSSCKRLEGPDTVGECWQEQLEEDVECLRASGRWARTRKRQCLIPVGLGLREPSAGYAGLWSPGSPRFSQAGGWDPTVDGGCPAISSGRKEGAGGCIGAVWERLGWRWGLDHRLIRALVVYS